MKLRSSPEKRRAIKQAFLEIREGWSPDRVVADPELNHRFEAECRCVAPHLSATHCNRILLNLRRSGHLSGLRSRRTSFPNQDDYQFAGEIAIRFLERRHGVTLDDVICDRTLAAEFDEIASRLAPGFSSLQYRWAALSLRKNRRLPPEILARVVALESIQQFEVAALSLEAIPATQGMYIFLAGSQYLYVGEADNLRLRLRKHLDHSDNRGLARWLWDNPDAKLFLEIQVISPNTPARIRKAMELELIRSRRPEFNVKR
jgi:site-specific DNA-methyltransferase (adenine-specific)